MLWLLEPSKCLHIRLNSLISSCWYASHTVYWEIVFVISNGSYWFSSLILDESLIELRLRGLATSRHNYVAVNALSPDCPASWLIFHHILIAQSFSEDMVPNDTLEGSWHVKKVWVIVELCGLLGFREDRPKFQPQLCYWRARKYWQSSLTSLSLFYSCSNGIHDS